MKPLSLLMLPAMLACSTQALVTGELCRRVRALETSTAAQTDSGSERRWVEFHWGFERDDAIWTWGCLSSKHAIAKATCDWLMQHTNQEFSMILPQAIMQCYGYRFPKFAFYDWDGTLGTFELRSANGRRLILDLNYRDLPGEEVAMRLAVEDAGLGKKYEPANLPPIAPMPRASPDSAPRS